MEIGVVKILRYVIMVVTSFDPEVNGLLSIPNFPKSILIISKLVLADTIINEHVAVSILTVINVNDELHHGSLISMRRFNTI